MFEEDVVKFRNANRQISSMQIVDDAAGIRERLIKAWTTSPSEDRDGREEIYRQIKGLDSIINSLITGWK